PLPTKSSDFAGAPCADFWTLCPEVPPSRSRWSTRGSSSRETLMPRTMSTISSFSASRCFCSSSFSRACCLLILALTLSISAWIFWLLLAAIDNLLVRVNARRRRNEIASSLYSGLHIGWDRHNGSSSRPPHRYHNGTRPPCHRCRQRTPDRRVSGYW